MKRLLAGLILSSLMALTVLVWAVPAQTSEAAGAITVTVNGCNAEVKWKPSRFASTQAVVWGPMHRTNSGTLSMSTTSYTIRGIESGTYALLIRQISPAGYQWSDRGPNFTITCDPAFPY